MHTQALTGIFEGNKSWFKWIKSDSARAARWFKWIKSNVPDARRTGLSCCQEGDSSRLHRPRSTSSVGKHFGQFVRHKFPVGSGRPVVNIIFCSAPVINNLSSWDVGRAVNSQIKRHWWLTRCWKENLYLYLYLYLSCISKGFSKTLQLTRMWKVEDLHPQSCFLNLPQSLRQSRTDRLDFDAISLPAPHAKWAENGAGVTQNDKYHASRHLLAIVVFL